MLAHVRKVRMQTHVENNLKYVESWNHDPSTTCFQKQGEMTPTYCTKYLDHEQSTEIGDKNPLGKDHQRPHEMMVDVEGPHFRTYCSIL